MEDKYDSFPALLCIPAGSPIKGTLGIISSILYVLHHISPAEYYFSINII